MARPARPAPLSACWCWPRPTRSASPAAWARTSSSASRNSRAPRCRACARTESVADGALIDRYLEHVRVEKRLAQRTVELYALDLGKLQESAARAGVALAHVQNAHVRRWVAQMHGAGRSGRGIALILSGWRGFYAWLGKQGLVASNPVVDVRAPKAPKPLPKALSVDDSVRLAEFKDAQADTWLEARDAAMVELLYGG